MFWISQKHHPIIVYNYTDCNNNNKPVVLLLSIKGPAKPKTYYIAHEILTTERTFVDALKLVFEVGEK